MSAKVIEWENEHALSAYPFTVDAPLNNVIVDASFQQFANFVPLINYIEVSSTFLTINLTYDTGTSNFVLQQADYLAGLNYIRLTVGTRYIGRITFADGVNTLWNNYVGEKVIYNLLFVASTVRSINEQAGVFYLNNLFGNIVLSSSSTDETVFFNTNNDIYKNFITFNAVGNHKFPLTTSFQALKKINLMSPVNNNIFIASSDVIQISGDGIGSLNVTLVGSQPNSNPSKIVDTSGF